MVIYGSWASSQVFQCPLEIGLRTQVLSSTLCLWDQMLLSFQRRILGLILYYFLSFQGSRHWVITGVSQGPLSWGSRSISDFTQDISQGLYQRTLGISHHCRINNMIRILLRVLILFFSSLDIPLRGLYQGNSQVFIKTYTLFLQIYLINHKYTRAPSPYYISTGHISLLNGFYIKGFLL